MSSPPPSWQPPAGSRPQGARQLCVYAPAKAPTPRPKRPASVSASVGARHRGTRVTEAVVAPRLAWRSFLAVHHRGGMSQPWRSVGRCPRPRPHRTTLAHLEPLTGLSLGGFLPVQVPPSAPVTSGDAPRRGRYPHRVHNCCSPVGAAGTTPGSFGGMPDGVEVAHGRFGRSGSEAVRHSRLIRPCTHESDTSLFTTQSPRNVPSRTNPSFSRTRADAALRVSVSAWTRFRSSVSNAHWCKARAASVA